MRKPIFDVIRAQRGKGFTQKEVEAIDQMLDTLGIPRDEAPVVNPKPKNLPESVAPTDDVGLDNPNDFFSSVKASLFRNSLKPDQKKGLEAVLAAAKDAGWPLAFVAYGLATAYHETAYTMQPVVEAFWLSESWRERNLRYYPYHGRGYVQLTWKDNYERADNELGLQGRLIAWDPVGQREVWRYQHAGPWNGGVLATAGNLVFQGRADGRLLAYDAVSGERLWDFNAGLGISAPPIGVVTMIPSTSASTKKMMTWLNSTG